MFSHKFLWVCQTFIPLETLLAFGNPFYRHITLELLIDGTYNPLVQSLNRDISCDGGKRSNKKGRDEPGLLKRD